jgi:CheY-like chemotaxis protein
MDRINLMPTILFVEDDDAFRYAACRHLRNEGYTVIDVPSSMEAFRVIDQGGDIDLVVADIALYPKEPQGVSLARVIRNKQPEMPILFVTGVLNIESLEQYDLPGEVLYKPVELDVLSRKITDLLS